MAGSDRSFNPGTLYVEARRSEIDAQIAEIHRARQVTSRRRLRHRFGQALIALGEALSEQRLDPAYVEPALPAAGKGC